MAMVMAMAGEEPATSSEGTTRMLAPAIVMAPASRCKSSARHTFALGSVLDSALALNSSWPSSVITPARSAAASGHVGFPVMKSFLEVILQCNKFQQDVSSLYEFWVLDHDSPVGYMLPRFVGQMVWTGTGFEVDDLRQTVHLKPHVDTGESVFTACEREFVRLCRLNMTKVDGVRKWVKTWDIKGDAEHHPIRGLGLHLAGLQMPSPLRGVFGIVTAGIHMNMYTMTRVGNGDGDGDEARMHIWMAKRSENVTYAGKLDQLVAGAMGAQDDNDAMKVLRREAMEEAGLAVDIETGQVHRDGTYVGTIQRGPRISFFDKKDGAAGSEHGQLEPGIRFTFDLQVDAEFVPEPCEPESIAGFLLKSVDEVKHDLKNREWKPNCALVMLDFLLRKGQMQPEEDAFLRHLKPALQRPLPFRRV
ncbi:hypothetical protein E4U42_002384 [Claviceps africana]|uniref:Nudix hydrolase domain-containing protein n=1 Tax=Claviceps africana TaxID=83212 RepID=A0A8K0NMA8_9HYPO|nr:hypothetical protein E4U42_002384 [Claviceps africana]